MNQEQEPITNPVIYAPQDPGEENTCVGCE